MAEVTHEEAFEAVRCLWDGPSKDLCLRLDRYIKQQRDLEATVEARVRSEYAELLSAVSAMTSGNKWPGVSREEHEHLLMMRLVAARDKFPRPCAARALTPSTSLPATAREKEDSNG
jgi:hypothetical protein